MQDTMQSTSHRTRATVWSLLLFLSIGTITGSAQLTINVDIQSGSGGSYQGINAAGQSGTWNHVGSDLTNGLVDSNGTPTNVSLRLFDAQGRWNSDWSSHALLEDFLYRDHGAWGKAEISGLDSSSPYDIFVYTGVEGGRYRIGSIHVDAFNNASATNADPVIQAGAPFSEGKNYVVFRNVRPNTSGQIRIEYQDSPLSAPSNGNFAGFTLEKKQSLISTPGIPILGNQFTIADLVVQQDTNGQISEATISGLSGAASFTLLRVEGAPPKATGGELDFLGFKFPISTAEVDTNRQVLTLTTQLGLPYPLFTDNNNQPIRQRVVLEVDKNGKVSIVGGQIFIPLLKAGGSLELANLNLQFDVRTGLVSGGVDVALGKRIPDPCNPLGPSNPFVGGFIEFRNGQLNSLSVTGSNLRKPVGAAYLDLVQASVFDLAKGNNAWSVQGRMVINGGCPIRVAGAADAFPITIDAAGTYYADRRFSISGQGKFFNIPVTNASVTVGATETTVQTGVSFGNIFDTQSKLTLRPGHLSGSSFGKLRVPNNTPGGIGGWEFPEVSASIDNNGVRGSISVLISKGVPEKCTGGGTKRVGYNGNRVCAPAWLGGGCYTPRLCCIDVPIPRICSPAIPELRPTFGFEYNWNSGHFNIAKRNAAERDPWDSGIRPRIHDPESNGTITFLTNWDRLDRVSTGRFGRRFVVDGESTPKCVIEVPEGYPGVFFRLAYSNTDQPQTGLSVTLPNGTKLTSDNGALPFGFDNALGYSRANPDAREVIVLLLNPAAGPYEVEVENAGLLEDYSVDAVAQNRLPFAEIIQVDGPNDEGIIDIYWAAEDISRATKISAFLEPNTDGNTGVLLAEKSIDQSTSEDDIEIFSLDLDEVQTQPGIYYIMLKTDDGTNVPDFSYSEIQFEFEHPDAPSPVPAIATAPGNHSFQIAWEPSDSTDVEYYNVIYGIDSNDADLNQVLTVSADTTEATVLGLDNGQPYLVSIVAGTAKGIQSAPSETHRVIPTAGPGLDRPIITSVPDIDATAGYLYTYFATGFDADAIHQDSDLPPEFSETAQEPEPQEPSLKWSLVHSPEGMVIHPSGLITWTPTEAQVGEVRVTVRLTKEALLSFGPHPSPSLHADQSFTINVLSPENLNGLEPHPYTFVSTPPLFTREQETYRYRPEVITPDEDYVLQLINGPQGMEITETNEVVWEVPLDSPGEYVWLRAITSNGDSFDQFYYLHVYLDWNQLPEPIRVASVERSPNGAVYLTWVGSGQAFGIQQKATLSDAEWETIAGPIQRRSVNTFIDAEATGSTGFYRVVEWANSPQ